MRTHLDCIPCLMAQALRSARRVCPDDEDLQRRVLKAWAERIALLDDNDMAGTAPALMRELFDISIQLTGCDDPYLSDKTEANQRVMEMLPSLEGLVFNQAPDDSAMALRRAFALSLIGNYIDSGVAKRYDWEGAIEEQEHDPALESEAFDRFDQATAKGARVVILGDNCGEIGLDTLLLRCLNARGCDVCYAVRAKPILNDATMEDALLFGLDKLCEVRSSGVDTPGTVLTRCDADFLDTMRGADVLLSKGQGNFESLYGHWSGIFYAFKAKCRLISRLLDTPMGHSVFFYE